jgi:hypothetical protein
VTSQGPEVTRKLKDKCIPNEARIKNHILEMLKLQLEIVPIPIMSVLSNGYEEDKRNLFSF